MPVKYNVLNMVGFIWLTYFLQIFWITRRNSVYTTGIIPISYMVINQH